jgi:RimJ/RimL family protein N-acetyltransferase
MEIATERLRLRPWSSADLGSLHRIWSDPQTIWWGPNVSLEQTAVMLEKIQRQGGWFAVEHEGRIVGNVFLRASPRTGGVLELGYHFESDSWGRGFATEAAKALLATAGRNPVEAPVVPENARSRRVMEKLGFRISGQLTHAGRLHDLWVLRVS